jgi:hypothetical protein
MDLPFLQMGAIRDLHKKNMQIISTTSDLGFKTVFGERPHLLMNLLNNFLPLPHPIVEIHYLNSEMIPEKKRWKKWHSRCALQRQRRKAFYCGNADWQTGELYLAGTF